MAAIIWSGVVLQLTYRVVDNGAGTNPRLIVEQQQAPDAMGGHGWSALNSIDRAIFEGILISAGVVH